MTRAYLTLISVVLAATWAVDAQSSKNGKVAEYVIEGKVTDWITGKGIAAATVMAIDSRKKSYPTLTLTDGTYRLEHLPPEGKLTLVCSQLGYSPNPRQGLVALKGGLGKWDTRLFRENGGADYVNAAVAQLSSMKDPDSVAEARFFADNVSADSKRILAIELRKKMRAGGSDSQLTEMVAVFSAGLPPGEPSPAGENAAAATQQASAQPATPATSTTAPEPEPAAPAKPNTETIAEANTQAPTEAAPATETASAAPPVAPGTTIQPLPVFQIKLTQVSADGRYIVTPGDVAVLNIDGLMMCNSASPYAYLNTYSGGVLSAYHAKNTLSSLLNKRLPSGSNGDAANNDCNSRKFVAGEKFWITGVKQQKDGIVVSTFSDPYNDVHYHGEIMFPLPKKSVFVTDGLVKKDNDLAKAIAEVITVLPADDKDNASMGGQAGQQARPPVPAAPTGVTGSVQAAAAPATVAVGQTKDQVTAALGKPERAAKVGARDIYYYKDMKVIFTNGRVSDIE